MELDPRTNPSQGDRITITTTSLDPSAPIVPETWYYCTISQGTSDMVGRKFVQKPRYENGVFCGYVLEEKPGGEVGEQATVEYLIAKEFSELTTLLLEKNRKYGSTATREGFPFKLQPEVAIKARINDKIGRLAQANLDEDEDIIKDLIGYLILLRVAQNLAKD